MHPAFAGLLIGDDVAWPRAWSLDKDIRLIVARRDEGSIGILDS